MYQLMGPGFLWTTITSTIQTVSGQTVVYGMHVNGFNVRSETTSKGIREASVSLSTTPTSYSTITSVPKITDVQVPETSLTSVVPVTPDTTALAAKENQPSTLSRAATAGLAIAIS
jgi:hypothetical protein